jgi:diacylglycerol O-acyltransferase
MPAKLSRRLTTQDASFLYGESESGPLHFGGLGIFQGAIDFARLLKHVEQRLDRLPRFRQRLAFAPLNLAHPTLEYDPDFRIENHIFCHELAEGTDLARMTEPILRVFEPRLDRNRPLWEMHLFHGLDGGRSAVLWKVHHCIVDGVSWVQILTTLFDFRRHSAAGAPAQAWEPKPVPGPARLLGDAAADLARTQFASARRLIGDLMSASGRADGAGVDPRSIASALKPAVAAPWNRGVVTRSRSFAWIRHAQRDVRTIQRVFGGTLNDVVLAALGEGAARYLKFHGCNSRGLPLRIGCPVNVRSADEMASMGNRVSMMLVDLDAEPKDPVARLNAVSEQTKRIKSASQPKALDSLMAAGDLVSPSLMSFMSSVGTAAIDGAAWLAERAPRLTSMLAPTFSPMNFIATNVRGPQLPAYLAGKKMLDYVGMIPLGASLGCGVVISTYNRNVYVAVMAEPRLMPDVELMKAFIDDAFEELKLAAYRVAFEHTAATAETKQPIEHPAAEMVAAAGR